ncbi:MAG TPA: metal ABC transporter ATPase [Pseudomonas xinjiangensis]|uniref:Metal ABC transporter ATPase n=2 Tax=root TaxID=1 RepID=A0A7V1BPX4_9GAMM|nr:metal ABC transporter ATPase [Halopseudomonas xinjiangensis]HEC49491.1 metal ABC transporter ATPase [Halopseudomonas xinjiangensis]
MSQIIARKNPVVFKTQAVRVHACPDSLTYTPVGLPQNFGQMQAQRIPVSVADPDTFELTVANLGVSANISLEWQGRHFHLLVRQDRPDQGDNVLKLLSGYVPAHELRVPLLTAMTEIAEELLLEGSDGWLGGRYHNTWLPSPYADCLPVDKRCAYNLMPCQRQTKPVFCGDLPLVEQPRAYVHLPSNSLQIVYNLKLELPEGCSTLSALHADEALDAESGELLARMDYQQPELFLAEVRNGAPTNQLYTLEKGVLIKQRTDHLWLSEALAPQTGWVVAAPRCEWPAGLVRL